MAPCWRTFQVSASFVKKLVRDQKLNFDRKESEILRSFFNGLSIFKALGVNEQGIGTQIFSPAKIE